MIPLMDMSLQGCLEPGQVFLVFIVRSVTKHVKTRKDRQKMKGKILCAKSQNSFLGMFFSSSEIINWPGIC